MPNRFLRLGRHHLAFAHDIVMGAVSFVLSLYLRLGDSFFYYSPELVFRGTVIFTVVGAVVFWSMGLYRGVWRYASLNDMMAVGRSATLAVLGFLAVLFLWSRLEGLPRSLPFINWFVLIALLGGPRFLYRIVKDGTFNLRSEGDDHRRVPVLLAGAGDGAELFIRALGRAREQNYRIVGIVSERHDRVGRHIHGLEVLGTLDEIPAVVEKLAAQGKSPERLVLTRDDLDGARVRKLLEAADQTGMTLARLPRMTDLRSEVTDRIEVKPVVIEDLLGRPQTPLDREAMRALIEGRRVLVTGAGGSIGTELVRQTSDFQPAEIVLLDNSEFNLYSVELELGDRHPGLPRRAILGDVRDASRVDEVIRGCAPELVFHAAALKHVPLVEANVAEGVATNVLGTVNVADACLNAGVSVMVLISTDKAVNPTSIMGATKRIAEQYCQSLGRQPGTETRFVTVRFGNVLGSTGSVVPLFQRQLARGGPITITHPEMKRYFMTVREAMELVLQASALGSRGVSEDGKIFVLDMGEPVRILDLAKQMIRLAGLRPDHDVKIEVIGPRPGEKLVEETIHGGEALVPTDCKGILLAAPRAMDLDVLRRSIRDLVDAVSSADVRRTAGILEDLVPEYVPWVAAAPKAASG
ncbi:MAG: nucleoside-diphosphate sugar epimerase/dehydratase [Rhodospirillales bacterium]|jgi:O-antigen biosynthesis protein WbqV|nr:nucleoside-diphosphate sugar epimerase/dehydratase [Rhodospirillales bacterium]